MNMFSSLTTEGLEETQDRIGGFQPFDSAIHTGTITMAYHSKSASGANAINLIVDVDGREYRETVYYTDKAGKNYYLNKNDPTKKIPLPGFNTVDDICLVTQGSSLSEQETEEKVVKIYDYDAKAEVPKAVPVLVGILGKTVSLGIVRQLENKSKKDGNGGYQPTAETREVNFIDKVFHTESKMTVAEARNGVETPEFWDKWTERNAGQVRDKRTIKDGEAGTAGRPGGARSGPPQAGGKTARPSLFAGANA